MENKRKIWVRVAAFMAAIICCVICVVPAYAESGEELTTIGEQEIYLNQLIEPLGVQLNLASNIGDADLLYSDIWYYGFMDHTDKIDRNLVANTDKFATKTTYVGGHIVANVYGSAPYEWGFDFEQFTVTSYKDGIVSVRWGGVGIPSLEVFYDAVTKKPYRIGYSEGEGWNYLEMQYGYTFDIQAYSYDQFSMSTFAPFGVVIQPRQLLELELPEGGYTQADLEAAWEAGHTEGYTNGTDQGYRTGYDDGMHQTSLIDGIKSLFRAPMEFVEGALNFEIFGIDLGDAVKALVSMMLLALVVTIVWKAVK